MNLPIIADFFHWLVVITLSSARILPLFLLLPFLSSSIISNTIRVPLVFLLGAALWPQTGQALAALSTFEYIAIISRELSIGLFLSIMFAMPFWIMHGIGSQIDNQRGATLSSSFDPISGVDTSELANLFNLFFAALFLQGGGLTLIVSSYAKSYQLCSPLTPCSLSLITTTELLNQLVSQIIMLSSPVLAALILCEVLLGLLSRFAPQMNAFAVSLTVKSGITFFILLFYFAPVLPGLFRETWPLPGSLNSWFVPLPGVDVNPAG